MSALVEKPVISDERLQELSTPNYSSFEGFVGFVSLCALGATGAVFLASLDTWDICHRVRGGIPCVVVAAAAASSHMRRCIRS